MQAHTPETWDRLESLAQDLQQGRVKERGGNDSDIWSERGRGRVREKEQDVVARGSDKK